MGGGGGVGGGGGDYNLIFFLFTGRAVISRLWYARIDIKINSL